jgi:metal-dependent HD superfamily phosphatase/phosphodiesterase
LSTGFFSVPCFENKKLDRVVNMINKEKRLQTLWKCSNITAINRMGYSDHGPTHVKIVANLALRLIRILVKSGITPSIVKDYKMTNEDAEVIVVLASAMHDLGLSIIREDHEEYGLFLSLKFLDEILRGIYIEEEVEIMKSEILHAIITHHRNRRPLTLEAGVVRVADALDMEKGRARIPFEAGKIDIHSVSALSIENVEIIQGSEKPIVIKISMSNSAGIFQVDELLREKIHGSGLEKYIQVIAEIKGEREKKIIEKFEI